MHPATKVISCHRDHEASSYPSHCTPMFCNIPKQESAPQAWQLRLYEFRSRLFRFSNTREQLAPRAAIIPAFTFLGIAVVRAEQRHAFSGDQGIFIVDFPAWATNLKMVIQSLPFMAAEHTPL